MVDLVEVLKNKTYADSHLVAKKFGYKHKNLVTTIKKLIDDVEKSGAITNAPQIIKEDRHYRGTDYTAYMMNREFFTLLVMRLRGKKAFDWQMKFNAAFYAMEERLLQLETNKNDVAWIGTRGTGKISRKEETDVIKDFVEYATNQGSKSAKFYYKHITNATYKALGMMHQRKPKLRDTMDIYEISELMLAERVAVNALRKYMGLGRHYKDIYESVKNDLIEFAGGLKFNKTLTS